MNEQLFFTDNRPTGAFLPLVLFGFCLALMLGFQMMDQVTQRSQWQMLIAQREPQVQNSLQLQNRLQALLVSFHSAAPDEAKALFQKMGIRFTPSATPPATPATPEP